MSNATEAGEHTCEAGRQGLMGLLDFGREGRIEACPEDSHRARNLAGHVELQPPVHCQQACPLRARLHQCDRTTAVTLLSPLLGSVLHTSEMSHYEA